VFVEVEGLICRQLMGVVTAATDVADVMATCFMEASEEPGKSLCHAGGHQAPHRQGEETQVHGFLSRKKSALESELSVRHLSG